MAGTSTILTETFRAFTPVILGKCVNCKSEVMTASCHIASNSLFTTHLPPLSCNCTDHSQQSHVLCFIKQGDCALMLYEIRLTSSHVIYFMLPKVLIPKKKKIDSHYFILFEMTSHYYYWYFVSSWNQTAFYIENGFRCF